MDVFRDERGKAREGNRGGLGLFKWEAIKQDEQKECYLGNSVKASTGRWQNHKNLHWFLEAKETPDTTVGVDELAEIKRMEAEYMAQALGAVVPMQPPDTEVIIKKDLEENLNVERVVGLGLRGDKRREVEWAARREHRDESDSKHKRKDKKERRKRHHEETSKDLERDLGRDHHRHSSRNEHSKSQTEIDSKDHDRHHSSRKHRDRSQSPRRTHSRSPKSKGDSKDNDRYHYSRKQRDRSRSSRRDRSPRRAHSRSPKRRMD